MLIGHPMRRITKAVNVVRNPRLSSMRIYLTQEIDAMIEVWKHAQPSKDSLHDIIFPRLKQADLL